MDSLLREAERRLQLEPTSVLLQHQYRLQALRAGLPELALPLRLGDRVKIKLGQPTAVTLDWETTENWWEGIVTGFYRNPHIYQRLNRRVQLIIGEKPKEEPTGANYTSLRIAPRGQIYYSYLRTPGYLDDLKKGKDLSYWHQEKARVQRWGIWISPEEDKDQVILVSPGISQWQPIRKQIGSLASKEDLNV